MCACMLVRCVHGDPTHSSADHPLTAMYRPPDGVGQKLFVDVRLLHGRATDTAAGKGILVTRGVGVLLCETIETSH